MNITIQKISNIQPNSTISYKGTVSASKLKNVPGNFCACCGHETIKSNQFAQMWSKIAPPMSQLMQKGFFNRIKKNYPDIFRAFRYFAKHYPEQSLAQTVMDDKNHEIFLDSIENSLYKELDYHRATDVMKERMKKNRTMSILQISESELKPAIEVMEHVKQFEPYMYDYHKDIVECFVTLAEKYPDKRLSEILKIPEVAEYYVEETYHDAVAFAQKRDYHWNRANKIILDKSPEASNALKSLHTEICKLYGTVVDPKRFIHLIKDMYRDIIIRFDLFDFESDILNELSQMPSQLYTLNSFMSYTRRYYTDGGLVTSITKPFLESEEHLIPLSKCGSDGVHNKIFMCRQCNDMRASHPYPEFLKYHPEMIENSKKQIRFYEERILSGEIPCELKDYPIEVAKTLLACTKGLINFDVSDYIQKLASHEILPEGF